jgi:hypothetical protein
LGRRLRATLSGGGSRRRFGPRFSAADVRRGRGSGRPRCVAKVRYNVRHGALPPYGDHDRPVTTDGDRRADEAQCILPSPHPFPKPPDAAPVRSVQRLPEKRRCQSARRCRRSPARRCSSYQRSTSRHCSANPSMLESVDQRQPLRRCPPGSARPPPIPRKANAYASQASLNSATVPLLIRIVRDDGG